MNPSSLITKFGAVTSAFGTIDDAPAFFADYHYYELYDPEKDYQKGVFEHDFGYGSLRYKYEAYVLTMADDKRIIYIVALETPTKEELEILEKYCQCHTCTKPPLTTFQTISQTLFGNNETECPCCMGCLKTHLRSQHHINTARKYMKDNGIVG